LRIKGDKGNPAMLDVGRESTMTFKVLTEMGMSELFGGRCLNFVNTPLRSGAFIWYKQFTESSVWLAGRIV